MVYALNLTCIDWQTPEKQEIGRILTLSPQQT